MQVATTNSAKATALLNTFFELGPDSVAFAVFKKAKGVAVFNDVTYFNLLLSKLIKGKGLLTVRDEEQWSVPTFVNFVSSGFEFKIADSKKFDVIVFIMDERLIEVLKKVASTLKIFLQKSSRWDQL